MNRFELIDQLVSQLGLSPKEMMAYWENKKTTSSIPQKHRSTKKLGTAEVLASPVPASDPVALEIPENDDIFLRMKKIIAKKFGMKEEDIKPLSLLHEDLKADSLDEIELVMDFEREFGIMIPDDQAAKFVRIQDAWQYIHNEIKP